jgi:U3 small nucleolar ribonucleoprotein protein LCP5
MTSGISLLSLKHHLLLSYLRSLVLVSSGRALGNTLNGRSAPTQPFSKKDRDARGNQMGDLIDSMIENRAVLEKINVLESKMRYQIDKLMRIAEEPSTRLTDGKDYLQSNLHLFLLSFFFFFFQDPLVFRPNPMSLMQPATSAQVATTEDKIISSITDDPIYRPPRMAPVPYTEKSKNQTRHNRPPVPSALSLLSVDPSRPFIESSSGLGGTLALASGRAQYLKRMKDFEEDNFTRLVMKKSEARRRARDEEDLALGGDLGSGSTSRAQRRAGGLEDEFNEVLWSVSRVTGGRSQGDGYEELRQKGRKMDALQRSRKARDFLDVDDNHENLPKKKHRTRFELETRKR